MNTLTGNRQPMRIRAIGSPTIFGYALTMETDCKATVCVWLSSRSWAPIAYFLLRKISSLLPHYRHAPIHPHTWARSETRGSSIVRSNSPYSSTALGMDSRPASPAHSKEGSIKTKGFSLNDEPERVPHQRRCSNKKGAPRPPRETEMIQGRLTAENKIAPAGHSWYSYRRHGD